MEKQVIGKSHLIASRIVLGCMRIGALSATELEKLIFAALKLGINHFDHGDIYGAGKNESLFGEVLKRNPDLRTKMIIQSKAGIRKGFYDNSKTYLLESVDKILARLNTDYLDIFLVHRPDALLDLKELAETVNTLIKDKKIRYFGVSNMNSMQIELIQKYINAPIITNQMQLSLVHSLIIDSGINVNMKNEFAANTDGSIIDYARLNNITLQAWSPLQASWEEGTFLENPSYEKLNDELSLLSEKYNVTKAAIAVAWILRHPAKIQAIVGTKSIKHLKEISMATKANLDRSEWYRLYLASGKVLP